MHSPCKPPTYSENPELLSQPGVFFLTPITISRYLDIVMGEVNTAFLPLFKALADETRLRILGVLSVEPLNVNEIVSLLDMGQSRISRHLKILTDAGLLESERAGSFVYYGIRREDSGPQADILRALGLDVQRRDVPIPYFPAGIQEDRARLRVVLEAREKNNLEHFQTLGRDRIVGDPVDSEFYHDKILELLPDRPGTIADVGCGAGELSRLLLSRAERLICVDQSSNMLERARGIVVGADFRPGALTHLPMGEGEADAVIASMVLHHVPEPMTALREIHRALRPGGILILADLIQHDDEAMREKYADFWLGFRPDRLRDYLEEAGFHAEREEAGRGRGRLECLFFRARRSESANKDFNKSKKIRRLSDSSLGAIKA